MSVTYDELFAALQSEKNSALEEKMETLKKQRYEHRFQGAYKDSDKKSEQEQLHILQKMKQTTYEWNRSHQICQLYSAYKKSNHIGDKMWISRTSTSSDDVRRVTGKRAHQHHNTEILYLDQDTIDAVQAVAEFSWNQKKENMELTPTQLEHVVDEFIACKNMLGKEIPLRSSQKVSANTLMKETDIIKRAIGKQHGWNVFDINDYSLTAKKILARDKSAVIRVFNRLKKTVRGIIKNNKDTNLDKLGNQTVKNNENER